MNKQISFIIPWPPSVNHYWGRKKTGALYLLQKGLDFRCEVALAIKRSGLPPNLFAGGKRLRIELYLVPPDYRRRDIDNVLKATFDAIEHSGLIDNDCCFADLHVHKEQAAQSPGKVLVKIRELIE